MVAPRRAPDIFQGRLRVRTLEKVMSKLSPARGVGISQVKVVRVKGIIPGWMYSLAQSRKESI